MSHLFDEFESLTSKTIGGVSTHSLGGNNQYTVEGYTNFKTVDPTGTFDDDFVDITNLDMSAQVTHRANGGPFSCNFSFNFSYSFNIELPNINPDAPNLSLLYKIDEFSTEVSKINDLLIRAIRDMNCCDVENAYNKNVVPFFRWFADNPDAKNCRPEDSLEDGSCGPMFGNETLPILLLKIAQVLINIYIVLRPLACLFRPLPGNPWMPADLDILQWAYSIIDFYDMYLDLVINGKLVDEYLIQPTRNFRQNIQSCISGKRDYVNDDVEKAKEATDNIKKLNDVLTDNDKKIDNTKISYNNFNKKCNAILQKYILYISNYEIKTATNKTNKPKPTENTSTGKKFSFKEILNYFYESSHNGFFDFDKNAKIGDKIDFFINNYQNPSNLKNFINEYFRQLNGKIHIDSLTSSVSVNYDVININELKKNEINNQYNKAETSWISVFNSMLNDIKNLQKLNNNKNAAAKQLKILNKTERKLQEEIDSYIKKGDRDVPLGVYPVDTLQANIRNILTKDGNPGNFCNCIAYLVGFRKEPWLYNLINLDAESMSNFKEKETILMDFFPNKFPKLKDYMYPNDIVISPHRINEKRKKKLYFSEKFINEMDKNFRERVVELTAKFAPNLKQISTTDGIITNYNNLFINFITIIEAFYDENKNSSDPLDVFLRYLDADQGKQAYSVYDFNLTKDVSLYNPYNTKTNTITMPYFDGKTKSKNIDPSVYFYINLLPMQVIYSLIQPLFNKNDNLYMRNVYDPDHRNFIDAKNKLMSLKNSILTELNSNKYGDLTIEKFNNYIKFIDDVENGFFKVYDRIDIINDPNEIKTREFKSLHHPDDGSKNKKNDDSIYTKFGTNASEIVQEYINKRSGIFSDNIKLIYERQYLFKFLNDFSKVDPDPIITRIAVWDPLDLPCKCSDFCRLIQMIINMLLAGLTKILNSILNAIIQWFMNTWIGKLIKIILIKLKCIMTALEVDNDLKMVNESVDALVNSLKGRINLYNDPSTCVLKLNNSNNDQSTPPLENPNNNKVGDDGDNEINNVINKNLIALEAQKEISNDLNNFENNFNLKPTTVTTKDGKAEINLGTQNNNLAQPAFHSQISHGMPAKLVLSDGVKVGTLNKNGFPILDFSCKCSTDGCNECKITAKVNATLDFIK